VLCLSPSLEKIFLRGSSAWLWRESKIPVQPLRLLLGWKEAQGMAPLTGALKALWICEEF
jgi:hypothetical protein